MTVDQSGILHIDDVEVTYEEEEEMAMLVGNMFEGTPSATPQTNLAWMFKSIIKDGICYDSAYPLSVTQYGGGYMNVLLSAGRAFVRGHWYKNDADLTLDIAASHATLDRIDRVVLRLTTNAGTGGTRNWIRAYVVTGTPASTPTAPALTQTVTWTADGEEQVWEISVATVFVTHTHTAIHTADITEDLIYASILQGDWGNMAFFEDLNMQGFKVVNLADPDDDTDACTKAYFDDVNPVYFGNNKCNILPWAGGTVPSGYLLCDGASLLRASYPDLFASMGTTFGSADGTHFNLPNLSNRTPMGAEATLGTTGGATTVTISETTYPAHRHGNAIGAAVDIAENGAETDVDRPTSVYDDYTTDYGNASPTAHNNLNPYVSIKYIVRAS
jgi:microcystin-dependent protein